MKINNRQHIRDFLVRLDRFIHFFEGENTYNQLNEDKIWCFFTNMIKANANERSYIGPYEDDLNVDTLVKYSNRANKGNTKQQYESKRKETFLKWVAYKLKWKYVKDLSYEHIFVKQWYDICEEFWFMVPYFIVDRHRWELKKHKDTLNEFLIPEDWNHSDDLFIYDLTWL